jgi:hypothetical protein
MRILMAQMTENSYRAEVEAFRANMSRGPESRGAKRTLYGRGTNWYSVCAEPGLKLYCLMENLYLKAFQNSHASFKFYGAANPGSVEPFGQIINATQLDFIDSYNSANGRVGLGFPQDQPVTVTLTQLNNALATMAATGFNSKGLDEQRTAVGRVVIGIIEAARFKDVEDHVVAGTQITDRNWPNHADQAAVMIQAP